MQAINFKGHALTTHAGNVACCIICCQWHKWSNCDHYQRLRRGYTSHYVRESENFCFNWNPRKFCFWYPESWVLETGIQSKDWESRIQVPRTKTGIQYLESGIYGVECKIQDRLGFLYMERYTSFSIAMRSLRKQLTFGDATTGFPAKWRLRNECRNYILMTCH